MKPGHQLYALVYKREVLNWKTANFLFTSVTLACMPAGPGSIPGRGKNVFFKIKLVPLVAKSGF